MATVACCHFSHSLCQQSEQNRQCAVFSVCAFTCNKNTFRLNEFIFGSVRGMPVIDKLVEKLHVNPDRQGTGINCNINRGRAADCSAQNGYCCRDTLHLLIRTFIYRFSNQEGQKPAM
jgi:hypothetical protein